MSIHELPYGRDAVNELFDHGCDVVSAAADLRTSADAPGAARAVPAVTGCLEAALRELALTAAALERAAAAEEQQGSRAPGSRRRRARRHQGFVNLEVALHDAADAAAAARALAARVLEDDG